MKRRAVKNKIRILCAMSGGVDSSVAAALLVASKKYEVVGAYMVNFDDSDDESLQAVALRATACWLPDYRDALRVAAHLGIPLMKFDFTKEYKRMVLDYMFREYEAGRTPNPDVLCNTFIKFGSWLDQAKELGFDYLATGHYAKVVSVSFPRKRESITEHSKQIDSRFRGNDNLEYRLMCAKDTNKDQTYFLHQLNQDQLKYTLFPVGHYTKPAVRKLALKFGLPTAKKEESMGICFVGEVPMKEFLESKIKAKRGKIILSAGTVIGRHDGLPFYTIGQRHGLSSDARVVILNPDLAGMKNLSVARLDSSATPQNDSKPLFVVDKRSKTNELVVGYEDDPFLYKKEVALADVHWVAGRPPEFPLQCEVRLRHRQPFQKATVESSKYGVVVKFKKPERAVTPGQFAVFYKKGECLGGGVII